MSHTKCILIIWLSIAGWLNLVRSWASCQIRKIVVCACAGNAGNIFPTRRLQMKPIVSDPGMHHGTCVTHVPWCMPGSLTCGGGENVPGIPQCMRTRNFMYPVRGPQQPAHKLHRSVLSWYKAMPWISGNSFHCALLTESYTYLSWIFTRNLRSN